MLSNLFFLEPITKEKYPIICYEVFWLVLSYKMTKKDKNCYFYTLQRLNKLFSPENRILEAFLALKKKIYESNRHVFVESQG